MTEIEIRPITEQEFNTWKAASRENYAKEKEKEGLSAADARAESEASFKRHLSEGINTPGHHVYSVVLRNSGAVVGTLWWGMQKQGTSQIPWIFDIVLDPSQRGKGLGRKLMELAQADVKAKGFGTLGLHVFGHNKVARSLYESLGFVTTNVVMSKKL
jgi:ribosomal protein S18 acetylase RimI-like enzyme